MSTDPYKYFRLEARELVDELGKSILEVERSEEPALTARLLRLAHTLKGAARVVKHRAIAEHAHAIETALTPLRTPGGRLSPAAIGEILRLNDEISAEVDRLGGVPRPGAEQTAHETVPSERVSERAEPPRSPSGDEPGREALRTVRADVTEIDALVDGVAEASVHLASVRGALNALEKAQQIAASLSEQLDAALHDSERVSASRSVRVRARAYELRESLAELNLNLGANVDQVERELEQVRDAAERLRLVPASTLFVALDRTARDAAIALGRKIVFRGVGGNVRLDADVLSVLQGALVQVVRNAVAHGIEDEAARARANKPAVGTITLEIVRRHHRVVFDCRDDGRGLDLDAVVTAAKRNGLLPTDAHPSHDEIVRLLLRGGLSTSKTVTEVAGRGIGLDVVRDAATRVGGDVLLQTAPGRGLSVQMTVPVSLASFDALIVETEGVAAAVPIDAVRRTLRVGPDEVIRTPAGDAILDGEESVPFVDLARLLHLPRRKTSNGSAEQSAWPALLVESGQARAAVAVSRLVGRSSIVMRKVPALAAAHPIVAGASLDSEGVPRVVVDPDVVVRTLRDGGAPKIAADTARSALPILVVDDSLTTRMLEQSILESAGYEVELATSAEEALEKARVRRYGLFLVDVEMPGMDGFTFVETTRRDPELQGVPCILVTSRAAPEDLQRGKDAGAHAYIIKGEFDQTYLLDTIHKLLVS